MTAATPRGRGKAFLCFLCVCVCRSRFAGGLNSLPPPPASAAVIAFFRARAGMSAARVIREDAIFFTNNK